MRRRYRQEQPTPKLSEELATLQRMFDERDVSLTDIIRTLKGRAYMFLLILLALPFVTPIPLPGLSTPFGIAIGLISLRLVLGLRPRLPKRIRDRSVPKGFFSKVFAVATRIIRWLETLLRPRWAFVFSWSFAVRFHALLILLSSSILLLPLPIPFSNSFPAWVVILIAGGLMERDGLAIILGYLVFLLGGLYFFLLGEAAQHLVTTFLAWLKSFF